MLVIQLFFVLRLISNIASIMLDAEHEKIYREQPTYFWQIQKFLPAIA